MSSIYVKGREGILDRSIDLTSDIRVMVLASSYPFSSVHRVVSDLSSYDNGRSGALQNKSFTNGKFRADNISCVALAQEESMAVVLYQYNPLDVLARLIVYINSWNSGAPFTPSVGQVINIVWDSTVGIFEWVST